MKFGKSAAEAAEEPSRGGAGGNWIRRLKEGRQTMRFLQEPENWTYYWEHFSPAGFSFACNNEEDCPGCTSDNEKMKKVERRIACNILHSFNGVEYVDVIKFGNTVKDKLNNRAQRLGTITDRDYTIDKYKTSGDRWDFDIEGGDKTQINIGEFTLKDVEAMLAEEWNERWGDPNQAAANRQVTDTAPASKMVDRKPKAMTIAPQPAVVASEEPPFEPTYQESDLRSKTYEDLLLLVKKDMDMAPPATLTTTDQVVDWLMDLQS